MVSTVIALAAWRSLAVRKRLLVSIVSRSSLVSAPESLRSNLEVIYQKRPIEDPCLVNVEVVNVGSTAIPSGSFDRGRSMVFDIGKQIVEILSVEQTPDSSPKPQITSHGSTFALLPELICIGEAIRAVILTAGAVTGIEVALNPFGDVVVELKDREIWERKRARRATRLAAGLTGLVVGGSFVTLAALLGAEVHHNAYLSATVTEARQAVCNSATTLTVHYNSALLELSFDLRQVWRKGREGVVLDVEAESRNVTTVGLNLPEWDVLSAGYKRMTSDLLSLNRTSSVKYYNAMNYQLNILVMDGPVRHYP